MAQTCRNSDEHKNCVSNGGAGGLGGEGTLYKRNCVLGALHDNNDSLEPRKNLSSEICCHLAEFWRGSKNAPKFRNARLFISLSVRNF